MNKEISTISNHLFNFKKFFQIIELLSKVYVTLKKFEGDKIIFSVFHKLFTKKLLFPLKMVSKISIITH